MKCIHFILTAGLLLAVPAAPAQDPTAAAARAVKAENDERFSSIEGHIRDLLDARADQEKGLLAIKRQIAELREQVSKPAGNFATVDDVKRLAEAIQEIEKKRAQDKEDILKEIAKLAVLPARTANVRTPPAVHDPPKSPGTEHPVNENGFYYSIKKNDNFSTIAQAYREQGVMVTTEDIERANPDVNPGKLKVNQKIFIPASKGDKPASPK